MVSPRLELLPCNLERNLFPLDTGVCGAFGVFGVLVLPLDLRVFFGDGVLGSHDLPDFFLGDPRGLPSGLPVLSHR